jgi:very-short-patch-repair endonuclease
MLGCKFRRQHSIAGFVVDFCCLELKLVIELDGESHYGIGKRIADRQRTAAVQRAGFSMVRIPNDQVTARRLTDIVSSFMTLGAKPE